MNPLGRFLVVALLLADFASRRQSADPGRRPAPQLSPLDVVKIQVYALQHHNEPTPNAGIWTTFQFRLAGQPPRHRTVRAFLAVDEESWESAVPRGAVRAVLR